MQARKLLEPLSCLLETRFDRTAKWTVEVNVKRRHRVVKLVSEMEYGKNR